MSVVDYDPKGCKVERSYKIACLVWRMVNLTLFRGSPFFCYGWRRFLLRCFGAKIDRTATVGRTALIDAPWNLSMRAQSMIGNCSHVSCDAPVVIGRQSLVGEYVHILTGSHRTDSPDYQGICSGVTIGENCWIASCAILSSGGTRELKIGDGAVVSAGAVVYSDVRPMGIAIGNPAHCVLDRKMKGERN